MSDTTDAALWRLPTYSGTDRVIAPGDKAGLVGEDTDPAYVCTVVEVSWTEAGWMIWDADGNDRLPWSMRYIGGEA